MSNRKKDRCKCGGEKGEGSNICRVCFQQNTKQRRPETYYKK